MAEHNCVSWVQGHTEVFSWCVISWILLPVKCKFRKLFFVTRDVKVLRDPLRNRIINQYSWFYHPIHWMQIWRTTQSAPRTSLMKARLVRFGHFVLTMPPQKILLRRRSDLFYFTTTCCVSERHEKWYKSSTVCLSSLGKIVDQCNSWRRQKGVDDCHGNC